MWPKLTRTSFNFGAIFLAQEQFAIKSRYWSLTNLAIPSTKFQFSNQNLFLCCKNNLISVPTTPLMSNSLVDEKLKPNQKEPEILFNSYEEPSWKGM